MEVCVYGMVQLFVSVNIFAKIQEFEHTSSPENNFQKATRL